MLKAMLVSAPASCVSSLLMVRAARDHFLRTEEALRMVADRAFATTKDEQALGRG